MAFINDLKGLKKFIVDALVWKANPQYNKPDYYGYHYEKFVYPWARRLFPEYSRLYKTNEEFTKYFTRDLNRKDPRLLEVLNEPSRAGDQVVVEQFKKEVDQQFKASISTPIKEAAGVGVGVATSEPRFSTPPPLPLHQGSIQTLEKPPNLDNPPFAGEGKATADIADKLLRLKSSYANLPAADRFIPPEVKNASKNLFTGSSVFFKKNVGKYLTLGRIASLVSGGIGAISGGIFGPAGVVGGAAIGAGLPYAVRGRGGKYFGRAGQNLATRFGRIFPDQVANPSPIKVPGNRKVLVGLLIGFLLITGVIGMISGPEDEEETPGVVSPPGFLDYTIPFRDSSVYPQDVKSQVLASFPGAKLEYWDDPIIRRSIENDWNPAFVLTLWIEETGASHTTLIRNGGSEIPVNGSVSKGHLGCAPSEDQTIDESLDCLFKNFSQYSNEEFSTFMARYSGGPASDPFSNNPFFPKNVKSWYSQLVPAGSPGALQPVTPTTGAVASCPIPNGSISTPSYQADPVNGHCSSSYGFACRCGTVGRRAKAIDVPTNGLLFVLPTVNNQPVVWEIIVGPYGVDSGEGGGVGYTFKTTLGSDNWYLDALHLSSSSMVVGTRITSGIAISPSAGGHIHMTMGKNIANPFNPGTEVTDCDPGWIASDFMCR